MWITLGLYLPYLLELFLLFWIHGVRCRVRWNGPIDAAGGSSAVGERMLVVVRIRWHERQHGTWFATENAYQLQGDFTQNQLPG